jgi:hypothetical protein
LLSTTFPGGNYTISTVSFADITLNIPNLNGTTNDGFGNTPFVVGTQDGNPVAWSGGKMLVDPTKELTLTTTAFTTNNGSANNRIGLNLNNNDLGFNREVTNDTIPPTFTFSGTSVQMQVLSGVGGLTAGATYYGSLEFNVITSLLIDLSTFDAGLSGGNGVSVYTAYTDFQIQAIPEPSTCAAIFGALALTGMAIHRRRRLQRG